MATSVARLKEKWTTGLIYAVVIAVLAAVVVYFGLYNAMPYELVVYDAYDQPVTVLFTDDLYNRSMELMMVSILFPVISYLFMYGIYRRKVSDHPEKRYAIAKEKFPCVIALILLVCLLVVWGFVSIAMISLGLGLDSSLFADAIMLRQFLIVYGVAILADIVLLLLGWRFFKPATVQSA